MLRIAIDNPITLIKGSFIDSLFETIKDQKYLLTEIPHFGFEYVEKLTVLVDAETLKNIKSYLNNSDYIDSLFIEENNKSCVLECIFKNNSKITLELIWFFGSEINPYFNIASKFESNKQKYKSFKVLSNIDSAIFHGFYFYCKKMQIPVKYIKNGILLESLNSVIGKLLHELYFSKTIENTHLKINTILTK